MKLTLIPTPRTDGPPVMISSTSTGHLLMWDLESQRLSGQIRNAHQNEVNAVRCLHGEALMVTASRDNTLKQVS